MSMEHNDIHRNMNPLLNVDEELSIQPSMQIPFFEKIGLLCALLISSVILLLSTLSFFIDLLIKFDYFSALLDIFIMLISMTGIYFIYNSFKRRFVTEVLIDTAFQSGVYARLLPLIEKIAQASVSADIILERISTIDSKIQSILKERYEKEIKIGDYMEEPVAVGTSLKFTVKTILLITITMAAFMFLLNFSIGSITPYGVILIFIMWWAFITNEYNLWKESSAWTVVFFPILVIPVTVMLFFSIIDYNLLIAGIYVSIGLYTLAYYTWAVYKTTGSLPIISTKNKEPFQQQQTENRFFALQQKGILKKYLEAIINRLEQQLQKDKENQEIQHAWKK